MALPDLMALLEGMPAADVTPEVTENPVTEALTTPPRRKYHEIFALILLVAGLGMNLKEWAALQGWNGRSLSQPEARGILVAALGMLAMHYGYLKTNCINRIDR